MNKINLFSFPLKILFIDDDQLFLKAISSTIGKNYNAKIFDSSITALKFLTDYKSFLSDKNFFRECIESENYDSTSQFLFNLNTKDIAALSNDIKRFDEIGVIIVDYKMPDLNGIELFREIKNISAKKILLTGEADTPEAIMAFNEGIIDRYIRKDTENLHAVLNNFIKSLSHDYFSDRTKNLAIQLEGENAFSDRIFQKYFADFYDDKNIREHYLLDKFGSLYLIDNCNQDSCLIIHTDKTLNTFVDVHGDVKWAEAIISKIKNRQLIPFFGKNREPWEVSQSEWKNCLHHAKVLQGEKQNYYIAHIENI